MKQSNTSHDSDQEQLLTPEPEGAAEDGFEQLGASETVVEAAELESIEPPEPRLPAPYIKTVSVQYGRKLNLGDFNSAEISLTIWADLDEEEDVQAALDTLYAQAKENVKKQALPLLKAEPVSLNYRETFLGVPVETNRKVRTGQQEKEK